MMTAIQTRWRKSCWGIGVTMITFLAGAWLVVSAYALGNQRYGTPWTITTKNDFWVGIGIIFVSLVGLKLFTSSLLGTLRAAGFLRPSPRPHSDSAMRQEDRKDDDQVTRDRQGCGRCGGATGPGQGYVFAAPAAPRTIAQSSVKRCRLRWSSARS